VVLAHFHASFLFSLKMLILSDSHPLIPMQNIAKCLPTYSARELISSPLFMKSCAEFSSQQEQTSGLVCGPTYCSVLRRATKLKSQGALDKIKRKSILAAWRPDKSHCFYSA
jgi:hypothetical protein